MALFLNKWGDIRGSVGDLTFSANAGGAYIRSKVTPMNPMTAKQLAARARLAALSSEFSTTLTDEQRQGWIDLAKLTPYTNIFGDKRYLNGVSMYVKVNSVLMLIGQPTLTNAPINLACRPLTLTVNTIPTTAAPIFNISVLATVSATESIIMYCTQSLPPAVNFVKNLYRVSFVQAGAEGGALDMEFDPSIGTVNIGQKMHAMFMRVDHTTGGMTLGVPAEATIIA